MNPEQQNNAEAASQDAPQTVPQTETNTQSGEEATAAQSGTKADDANTHKVLAIVGYILPFLFFLPLVSEEGKKSEFAMFHANQHLILLIGIVGLYVIHNMFYMMLMVGGFFLMQLINLAFLVFVVIGIINAAKGEMKELPLIGGFKILNK